MATAQSVIDSARYDMGDYGTGIMWDNAELLNYLNRMVEVMNSELVSLESELVEKEETDIDCVSGQKYVDLSGLNSGLWTNLIDVWIGQDKIEQISVRSMRYKRIFRPGQSAQPYYWALQNQQLMFEQACASSYTTLTLYYNEKPAVLTLSSSMPYQDRFNNTFRAMLSMYVEGKRDGNISSVNRMVETIFKRRAMEEVVRRDFVQKPYYIDF